MKKFKKLSALLLAVIMTLAMAVPAMAASSDDKGNLVVNGVTKGSTVTFYKLAAVEYQDGNVKNPQNWATTSWAGGLDYNSLWAAIENSNDLETLINGYASKILATPAEITPLEAHTETVSGTALTASDVGTATYANAGAGIYIAIVTDPKAIAATTEDGKFIKADGTLTTTPPTAETFADYRKEALVYNPLLLSLLYDGDALVEDPTLNVDPNGNNLSSYSGAKGTAKASAPVIKKDITDGVKPDASVSADNYDEDTYNNVVNNVDKGGAAADGQKTVNIGDVIDYRVSVVLPQYPTGATNKTVWVGDTFDAGLDFIADSFGIAIDGTNKITPVAYSTVKTTVTNGEGDLFHPAYTPAAGGDAVAANIKDTDLVIVKDNKVVAIVEITAGAGGGFKAVFDYDKLNPAIEPVITYQGKLNADAKIGAAPNKNTVTYIYTNNPNDGKSHDKPDKPEDEDWICEQKDEEVVYTYEVALVKTDDLRQKFLPGAEFKLYRMADDFDETNKTVDQVVAAGTLVKADGANGAYVVDTTKPATNETFVTDADGKLTVKGLSKGKYIFVETKAPTGYTLPAEGAKSAMIDAKMSTMTRKASAKTYTTDDDSRDAAIKTKYPNPVGYSKKDDTFDDMITPEAYSKLSDADKEGYKAMYIATEYFETVSSENISETNPAGIQDVLVENSQVPVLPSTGGIGTYIFTIAGVAILAIAAFLLIFKRRKVEE